MLRRPWCRIPVSNTVVAPPIRANTVEIEVRIMDGDGRLINTRNPILLVLSIAYLASRSHLHSQSSRVLRGNWNFINSSHCCVTFLTFKEELQKSQPIGHVLSTNYSLNVANTFFTTTNLNKVHHPFTRRALTSFTI